MEVSFSEEETLKGGAMSRSLMVDFIFIFSFHFILFFFFFFLYFSIF